jgi:hypothetical protein
MIEHYSKSIWSRRAVAIHESRRNMILTRYKRKNMGKPPFLRKKGVVVSHRR